MTLWRDRAKGNARDGLFWLTVIERDRADVKPKLDWAASMLWAAGDVLFFERRVLRSYQFGWLCHSRARHKRVGPDLRSTGTVFKRVWEFHAYPRDFSLMPFDSFERLSRSHRRQLTDRAALSGTAFMTAKRATSWYASLR